MPGYMYLVIAACIAVPIYIICKIAELGGKGAASSQGRRGSAAKIGGRKIRDIEDLADAVEDGAVKLPSDLRVIFRDLHRRLDLMDVEESSEGDMATLIEALERITEK